MTEGMGVLGYTVWWVVLTVWECVYALVSWVVVWWVARLVDHDGRMCTCMCAHSSANSSYTDSSEVMVVWEQLGDKQVCIVTVVQKCCMVLAG